MLYLKEKYVFKKNIVMQFKDFNLDQSNELAININGKHEMLKTFLQECETIVIE